MSEKRRHERIVPNQSVLVKEDTGEIINYYHVKDISLGGMYLLKKISSKEENTSTFTFLLPELSDHSVKGEVYETRLDDNGVYGTSVRFTEDTTANKIVDAIKKL
jgi:hypothetical protein